MARTNYTGEAASTEAAAEPDTAYAEQQSSRLQGQRESAMDMATENTIDSEQNETV